MGRQLEFSVKLFDTTSFAADGSNIPRRSCEEYLKSDDYRTVIENKLGIGGESHKDRRLKPELKGLVGMDDQVLIHNNALHYYTKLYFKPFDEFLYADATTFDPDLFAGERKDRIINEIGMLSSGVRLPVSVVIQAMWSKRGTAERIVRIKGFDFTLNPSFKGAGDVELYSEVAEDLKPTDDQIKQFSDYNSQYGGDLEFQTKIFSCTGEVISFDQSNNVVSREYSRKSSIPDVIDLYSAVKIYGIGSKEVKIISAEEGQRIEKEDLERKLKDRVADEDSSDGNIVLDIHDRLNEHSDEDDSNDVRGLISGGDNQRPISDIIDSVPDNEPTKKEIVDREIDQSIGDDREDVGYFSESTSIGDRLITADQPRYSKIVRLINGYKTLIRSRELRDSQLLRLKLLFIQDLNLLIKDVLPEVKKGRSFNTIYFLSRFGDDVKNTSEDLSTTYRKVLVAESVMGFIPKTLYGVWLVDMQKFYKEMLQYVFGESLKEFQMNLIDYKVL